MNKKNISELTPVQEIDGFFFKRDDLFKAADGAYGGKARVVEYILSNDTSFGHVVTCGSRDSRQCELVARICKKYERRCDIFVPSGNDTDVIKSIESLGNATLHRTKVGYNNVLISQSKHFAETTHSLYIPFGLECQQSIDINKWQVQNIPQCVKRIVIPCGGGMNMASVIKGVESFLTHEIQVVGVVVGKDPKNVLERFVGEKDGIFSTNVNYKLVYAETKYHQKAKSTSFCGIELDEVYEAKCIPFMQKGDLLWIVGKRENLKY